MGKIILYHGSQNEKITPRFGLGNEKHDYGKGFYLTESMDLAKEWAVCRPEELNGWMHKFELEIEGPREMNRGYCAWNQAHIVP